MPRHPAKPITLILPSPSATSAPSSSSKPPSSGESSKSTMSGPPSLQVLLYAQQLAQQRGQIFDIEAFMSPQQRAEYYTTVLHRSPPPASVPLPLTPMHTGVKRPLEDDTASIASPAGTPGAEEGSEKKRPRIPGLAGLHWKQRQKKLAEIAKLEAEGEKVDYETFLAPTPKEPPASAALTDGVDAKSRGSIPDSASYWNHLLIQARKDRGPQWDYNSQSYHFDRGSTEYYTHGKEPPEDKPVPPPPPPKMEPNTLGMTNGTPRSNGEALPPPTAPASISRRQSESQSSAQASAPSSTPQQAPPPRLPASMTNSTYPNPQSSTPQFRPPQTQPSNPSTPSPAPPGLNPQQLAALSSANGGFNPAMLQMARAAAANQQGGMNGLSPAQLAQFAGMAQFQNAAQMQGFQQGRPGGMPPGMQMPGGQQGMQGMQGMGQMGMGQVRPGGVNPAMMFQQMNGGAGAGAMGGQMPGMANMANLANMQGMPGMSGMTGMAGMGGMGAMGRPPQMGMMAGQPGQAGMGANGSWNQGGR